MSNECLFCRIVAAEIPATVVFANDLAVAFRDINPQAPTHVVVVPRAHHRDAAALAEADPALAGELLRVAGAVAEAEGFADSGYRLVFNTGVDGGQTVEHVHCHLLGGRGLSWPPG